MGRLNGLNEMINAARSHWSKGREEKQEMTDLCAFWVMAARLKPYATPVLIHFDWIEPNSRRDPDNIRAGAKYVLDALKNQSILPQDSRKWIKGISDAFPPPDALKPRVVVRIEDYV